MQTSKYLFAAGVFAAVILPLQVQGGPDSDEQAKLREALRRALEQPNAPAPAAPVPAEPAPAETQPQPAPVTPVAPPPATSTAVVRTPETFEPVPGPDDAASLARARDAMRQRIQELQATPTAAPVAAPAFTPAPTSVAAVAPPPTSKPTPAPAPAAAPVATSTYKAIDAPASPFSAAKQAKLADLLARYRADAITSQEYHTQRAAIIAEP